LSAIMLLGEPISPKQHPLTISELQNNRTPRIPLL
jgi:hypothetical protein